MLRRTLPCRQLRYDAHRVALRERSDAFVVVFRLADLSFPHQHDEAFPRRTESSCDVKAIFVVVCFCIGLAVSGRLEMDGDLTRGTYHVQL